MANTLEGITQALRTKTASQFKKGYTIYRSTNSWPSISAFLLTRQSFGLTSLILKRSSRITLRVFQFMQEGRLMRYSI
jgi:hypothetical protein